MRTALLGLALLALTACAGMKAREHALLPAMKLAWPPIVAHIERGSSELEPTAAELVRTTTEQMTAALEAGEPDQVAAVNWGLLQRVALDGINLRLQAGEIGPGVARSLVERVAVFTESFLKLGG